MALQLVDIGSAANDGTGDPLRTAFDKINDNFQASWNVLARRGNAFSAHTGTTSETVMDTIVLPGGTLGPNGLLRFTLLLGGLTNNANAKTPRFRLGGVSGTVFFGSSLPSTVSAIIQRTVWNQNAENSQVTYPSGTATSFSTTTAAITTGAVDTSVNQDIVLSLQLADGADSMTLRAYLIETLYGA